MKERGILFSAPMVRQILVDAKDLTRRIVPGIPPGFDQPIVCPRVRGVGDVAWRVDGGTMRKGRAPALVGDRLWVREAWRIDHAWDKYTPAEVGLRLDDAQAAMIGGSTPIRYMADGGSKNLRHLKEITWGRYRHARFMPRWASRITLNVVSVRVERLHDIDDADAIREGCSWRALPPGVPGTRTSPRDCYVELWNGINGAGAWDLNPYVWRVEFSRVPRG